MEFKPFMASTDSTQQQAVGEQNLNSNTNNTYANLIKKTASSSNPTNSIKLKTISFFQGEPSITFDSTDIEAYIKEENLQYALVLKFSHGHPDIHELRKHFPLQFKIKGECNIGLLHPRHFLLRFSLVEDFVNIYSRSVESVLIKENGAGQEYEFRVQRWTTKFSPKEETSIALAWISFPGLPCQMFARQAIYSLASAVGRPLHVDKATADKTRPSTARVKVEVNLVSKLPDRVRMCYRDVNSGEISIEWQTVKYDKLPKYCTTCKKQGHGDEECRLNIQQHQQYDYSDVIEQSKLDKSHGDLRNKLNDQRKKASDGKAVLDIGGRNSQLKSVAITTEIEQEHITSAGQIIDVTDGNISNSNTSPKGKETELENGEEWEIVQSKKHGRRRSPIARSTIANSIEMEEAQLVQQSGLGTKKIQQESQTIEEMATSSHEQSGKTNGSGGNSQGKNHWVHGDCNSKELSSHVGKGQQYNMTQQNTTKVIGGVADNQSHASPTNLKNGTSLSATQHNVNEKTESCATSHGMGDHLKARNLLNNVDTQPSAAHFKSTNDTKQQSGTSKCNVHMETENEPHVQELQNAVDSKKQYGMDRKEANNSSKEHATKQHFGHVDRNYNITPKPTQQNILVPVEAQSAHSNKVQHRKVMTPTPTVKEAASTSQSSTANLNPRWSDMTSDNEQETNAIGKAVGTEKNNVGVVEVVPSPNAQAFVISQHASSIYFPPEYDIIADEYWSKRRQQNRQNAAQQAMQSDREKPKKHEKLCKEPTRKQPTRSTGSRSNAGLQK